MLAEDGGSKDTLHNKLGVSYLKRQEGCLDSNHTFKHNILNPMGSMAAIRLKDIVYGFSCLSNSFTPSFKKGLTVIVLNYRLKHTARIEPAVVVVRL